MAASEILSHTANRTCFDCDVNIVADAWTSISHGTLICLNCAGVHRGLGVHISFVRSLMLDEMRDDEMSVLRRHGNAAFAEFLSSEEVGVSRRVWLALPLEV